MAASAFFSSLIAAFKAPATTASDFFLDSPSSSFDEAFDDFFLGSSSSSSSSSSFEANLDDFFVGSSSSSSSSF